MNIVKSQRALFFGVAAGMLVTSVAQAAPKGATAVFLEYHAALEKATAVPDLLPYMPKSRREMLGVGTPEELDTWFKSYVGKRRQTSVKALSEKPFDKGVVVSAQGSVNSSPMLGRIEMLKEGNGFVVGDETWYPKFEPAKDASAAKGDFAKGKFTVDGKTAEMKYAYASLGTYSFNQELPEITLLLSDVVIDPRVFDLQDRAKKGELHYMELTIGPEQNVTGGMMYHEKYSIGYVSMAGMHNFDAKTFGPTVISGRVYLNKPEEALGSTTFYDVEFQATLLAK